MSEAKKSALELANEARRAKQAAGGIERLSPPEKALRNPKSLRLAIDAKCWDCVGGDCDAGPRQRIRDCPCDDCSLYPVRPFQKVRGASGYVDTESRPEPGPQDHF